VRRPTGTGRTRRRHLHSYESVTAYGLWGGALLKGSGLAVGLKLAVDILLNRIVLEPDPASAEVRPLEITRTECLHPNIRVLCRASLINSTSFQGR
jgi:hypothetical protein